MALFELGLPTKSLKYWLLQLFPLFLYARDLCQKGIFNKISSQKPTNYLGFAFFMFISELLSGIIIVIKYRIKKKNTIGMNIKSISKMSKSKITVIRAKNHKQWIYLLLIIFSLTLIDGFSYIVIETTAQVDNHNMWFQLQAIELISCAIASRLFLNKLLYRHQIMAIVFISIGVIIFGITPIKYSDSLIWATICKYVICYTLWGIQDSIFKWLMDVMFVQPETILFIEGLIGIIIVIITGTIEAIFELNIFKGATNLTCFGVIKQTFLHWEALILLGYIPSTFAYNYMILLLTKFYSPTQKIISDLMMKFFIIIYLKSEKTTMYWEWIVLIIGFCFTLIGCIIFDEILIVNMCDLGINTKDKITKRGNEDSEQLCSENDEELNEQLTDISIN